LSREASAAEGKLRRLYVEDGITARDEVLKVRLAISRPIANGHEAHSTGSRNIRRLRASMEPIERFGSLMRENIATGEIPFRKGSKSTLEKAVIVDSQAGKGVRGFVRNWRARRDSNS
jgi:site-specific DNA recombinase